MKNIFEFNDNPYSLRNDTAYFKSRNVRTVRYGIETASFVGPRIWNSIPKEIKESASLQILKIKSWTPKNFPSKLCKNYVQHLSYLFKVDILVNFFIYIYMFYFMKVDVN